MIVLKLFLYSIVIFIGNVLLMSICGTLNGTQFKTDNAEKSTLMAYMLLTVVIEIAILVVINT